MLLSCVCCSLSRSRTSLTGDSESLFDFPSPVNHLLSKLTKVNTALGLGSLAGRRCGGGDSERRPLLLPQHMRSPSVSCLDVDTSSSASESGSAAQTPSTPVKSHRRSISCGNNPPNNVQGSGPDMRIDHNAKTFFCIAIRDIIFQRNIALRINIYIYIFQFPSMSQNRSWNQRLFSKIFCNTFSVDGVTEFPGSLYIIPLLRIL